MSTSNIEIVDHIKNNILIHKGISNCESYSTYQNFQINNYLPVAYIVFEISGDYNVLVDWRNYLQNYGFVDNCTDTPHDKSIYFIDIVPLRLNILCVYIRNNILLPCTDILFGMLDTSI